MDILAHNVYLLDNAFKPCSLFEIASARKGHYVLQNGLLEAGDGVIKPSDRAASWRPSSLGVEALSEPAVNFAEHRVGLVATALFCKQARETHRRTQLKRFCALPARDFD